MEPEIGREAEIEITPAMIEAGVSRLLEYSPEGDIEEEAAREIFLAMWRARPLLPSP
jgi:hypothetical protein